MGVKIAGPDLQVIEEIGQQVESVLQDIPGTASAFSERVVGGRYVNIKIDRYAASRLGLNIADVQEVVSLAVGGMNVSQSVEGLERYPINLRYPRDIRDSVDQLANLPIVTPLGARIPLGEVAEIRIEDGPGMIKSENARPNGWVYVEIEGRALGSYVADAQQAVRENINLPAGYSINWSGQYEYLERALDKLKVVVPFTLAVIVLLLYLHSRNFIEVAIILASLPLAMGGGFWLMFLLGYDLSIASVMGFIALAGVAVETGVVMMLYLNLAWQRRLAEGGVIDQTTLREAVVEGALLRLRPKLMTVMTIIAGLLPLMLGSGTGSEVMKRIAAPMVGGMISSTVLILLLIPAVFLLWKSHQIAKSG